MTADRLLERLRAAAQDTFGERLELLREAGAGGMGRVYEAIDRANGRRLAIKVLLWQGEGGLERFHRESEVLESLSHPAIVAYIAHGTTPDGEPYLAMEWLEGESLSHRLRREPLEVAEAVELGRRVASALVAAHARGVIHRDVKPSNVFLRHGRATEAVLLDFGVARRLERAETLTNTGQLIGTPGYMAPEQARGHRLDGRADLFSLGCVLYDALTGVPPFSAPDAVSALAELLLKDPPGVQSLRPEIPDRLAALTETLIAKELDARPPSAEEVEAELTAIGAALARGDQAALAALEPRRMSPRRSLIDTAVDPRDEMTTTVKRPNGRDATAPTLEAAEMAPPQAASIRAAEVSDDVGGDTVPPTAESARLPVATPPRRRRWGIIAVVAAAAVAGGGALYLARRDSGGGRDGHAAARSRKLVAVIGFRDVTGKGAVPWLSDALEETLRREVEGAGGALEAIPGETTTRAERDLDLAAADSYGGDTLQRIRSATRADVLVIGSYVATGSRDQDELRVDIRLQDCVTGEITVVVTERRTVGEFLDVVERAGIRLRAILGAGALSSEEEGQLRASRPPTPAAARLYATGLDHLHRGDYGAARARLEEMVALEPTFAPGRAALAETLFYAGYQLRAQAEAEKAAEQAASLPPGERLAITAYHHLMRGEHVDAARLYRQLAELRPDADVSMKLAQALGFAGKLSEAYAVLAEAAAGDADDARIDLLEARLAQRSSDHPRAKAAAERAAGKARAQGSRLLLAEAKLRLGWAVHYQGDDVRSAAEAEEARALYHDAGDGAGEAEAKEILATLQSIRGQVRAAKRINEERLSFYRRVGGLRGAADALNSIGWQAFQLGELEEAGRAFDEEVRLFAEAANENGVAVAQGQIARLAFERGDFDRAEDVWSESAETLRRLGNRAQLARRLAALGELALARGDRAGARARFAESAELHAAIGDPVGIARAQVDEADLLLAEGKPDDAERTVRQALPALERAEVEVEAAHGRMLLVETLLAQRRFDAALTEIGQRGVDTERVQIRIGFAALAARTRLARGGDSAARRTLGLLAAEYERMGFVHRARELRKQAR